MLLKLFSVPNSVHSVSLCEEKPAALCEEKLAALREDLHQRGSTSCAEDETDDVTECLENDFCCFAHNRVCF